MTPIISDVWELRKKTQNNYIWIFGSVPLSEACSRCLLFMLPDQYGKSMALSAYALFACYILSSCILKALMYFKINVLNFMSSLMIESWEWAYDLLLLALSNEFKSALSRRFCAYRTVQSNWSFCRLHNFTDSPIDLFGHLLGGVAQ